MTGISELKTDRSVMVHCCEKVRLRSSTAFSNAFWNSNAMSVTLEETERTTNVVNVTKDVTKEDIINDNDNIPTLFCN